jgi:hypothetical protein
VRALTFRFIPPQMTDQYKIPNPYLTCHTTRRRSGRGQP